MSDPQDRAEALDEDVLGADEVDDIGEDVVRATYPPDHQQGTERDPDLEPDVIVPDDDPVTGLVEPDDDPEGLVAEQADEDRLAPAEEAAVHETADPPLRPREADLDEDRPA